MTDFIVMADGGSRGNPGAAAYGTVVIEVATKKVLIEKAGYLGIATNVRALED
jgi:ribonuclease HI